MLRVVSVADHKFIERSLHLRNSLERSANDFVLTVYCDDPRAFAPIASSRCQVKEWRPVAELGAKRAKLTVFADAVQEGGFLYLDADAIVLERLDEFQNEEAICGSPDDLSECSFVSDRAHPWPNMPELTNDVYLNASPLYFPEAAHDFVATIAREVLDDHTWQRLISPGKLYDNHFFCAQLNLKQQRVRLVDPLTYGWQGLFRFGQVQVVRNGSVLTNRHTGQVLRIAAFAGLQQSTELLLSLPLEVSSLLFARIMGDHRPPERSLADCVAALDAQLVDGLQDEHVTKVLETLLVESLGLMKDLHRPRTRQPSYFTDPLRVRAVAFATPDPCAEWNGLRCGGAYLDGQEYNVLRDLVTSLGIRRVMETGAGESSIMFRRLGIDGWSLESAPGSWSERAAREGCRVMAVPFDDQTNQFHEPTLASQLAQEQLREVDLIFIDSPVGTLRRAGVLSQLTRLLKTRYVLYHDALRDAANVFADQQRFGLRMVRWFETPRGLVLFEMPSSEPGPPLLPLRSHDIAFQAPRARLELLDPPTVLRTGSPASIGLDIENHSEHIYSSDSVYPVHISYHWFDSSGRIATWDGLRTRLPHEVHPNDRCRCRVDISAPECPGSYQLQVSLVQETVCWFHDRDPVSIASHDVDVVES